MTLFNNVYFGKTVVVTGHTGFKGSWLSIWLTEMGARVIGISHESSFAESNFECSEVADIVIDHRVDIRNVDAISKILSTEQPDFVFHLAAQALVRTSYESPLETMSVNALGSVCVLEALRCSEFSKPVTVIMITSDKAYDNVEWKWGYRETDPLGGRDPYSASKGMAELGIRSYVDSYFNTDQSNIFVGITRAGNVIGGGDWSPSRIIPDCVKSWSKSEAVSIRSPSATRPWQHVLEPLSGYLLLGELIARNKCFQGQAYNFGPNSDGNYSVKDLIDEMSKHWEKVRWEDVSDDNEEFHEAGLLKLNCDKALFDLNWRPVMNFQETVRMTAEWYRSYYGGQRKVMRDVTIGQIGEFVGKAKIKSATWAVGRD